MILDLALIYWVGFIGCRWYLNDQRRLTPYGKFRFALLWPVLVGSLLLFPIILPIVYLQDYCEYWHDCWKEKRSNDSKDGKST